MNWFIYIITFLSTYSVVGQNGFEFLNQPVSSRAVALGGKAVSIADRDISMSFHNPAILDSVVLSDYSLMYNPYFAGINKFSAITYQRIKPIGLISIGAVYLDYGWFDETDLVANINGKFKARDYAIYLGKSTQAGPFTLGVNLKYAGSVIASSAAHALMVDIGGIYRHQNISFGMVFRNLGFIVSNYTGDNSIKLPFDVEVGSTFKPMYMPVRFTITVSNLVRTRSELYIDELNPPNIFNEIFRYFNLGGAFILGKNIELLLGYNHRLREELRLESGAFGAGINFGILIKIKDYQMRFARAGYHASGGTNFISLQSNFNAIKKIF